MPLKALGIVTLVGLVVLVRTVSYQQDPCLTLNRLGLELDLGPVSRPLDASRGRDRLAAQP